MAWFALFMKWANPYNSNSQYTIGMHFSLEKMSNGRWYQLPVNIDPNSGFNEDFVSPLAPSRVVQLADWEWLYGTLDTGEYRIVKDISDVEAKSPIYDPS
ncbi:immunoglobulin-like domain-containing protein [Dethiobacter alkaliphilus]|uniref:immunoglobulin-like domain-containing protein n=1 Tax=Dethiobacter alkaliphilus TaxID=427926 RepID=UPI0022268B46|nr:immunoglobulin-like domain-containing protein [Dethiobacter alkaliphilus]MCW3491653.1 hypothetical protein [Dethiobacter alkaliphilus]